jgi:hypothetical protein
MWIALLLCSWTIEGVAGVWFCYHYWMFTQWRFYGDATMLGPGYAVVQLYNGLMTPWYHTYALHRYPSELTQEQVARFFVVVYIAFHALALMRGLSAPARERHKLGVRRQPSVREVERFDRAFAILAQARATIPGAPPLKKPRWWQMLDGRNMRIHWVGWVLVIDQGILENKHFPALLAHEIGHFNSFDLLTRTLYSLFPPLNWLGFTFVGMPNGCGRTLLYPLWMKYWRDRVFACDEYASRMGQRHQLIRALDDLKWTIDGSTATKGGRWLRETPYVESRIDRLLRYQAPQALTV